MKQISIILFLTLSVKLFSQTIPVGGSKLTGSNTWDIPRWDGTSWTNSQLGVGAFGGTENSNGLAYSGGVFTLRPAGFNGPGGVSLLEQFFQAGTGRKIITSDRLGGQLAVNDASGTKNAGIEFTKNGGIDVLGRVTMQGATTGSILKTSVAVNSVQTDLLVVDGTTKSVTNNGFRIDARTNVGLSLDMTDVSQRYSNVHFNLEDATLTLPNPSVLEDGTAVNWTITTLNVGTVTINTPASVNEFWIVPGNVSQASISIGTGSNILSGRFEVITVNSTKYWMFIMY